MLRAPVVASSAGFFEQVCSWAVGFKLRGVEEGIPAEAFDFAAGLEGHFDVKHSSLFTFRRSMQQCWGMLSLLKLNRRYFVLGAVPVNKIKQ